MDLITVVGAVFFGVLLLRHVQAELEIRRLKERTRQLETEHAQKVLAVMAAAYREALSLGARPESQSSTRELERARSEDERTTGKWHRR